MAGASIFQLNFFFRKLKLYLRKGVLKRLRDVVLHSVFLIKLSLSFSSFEGLFMTILLLKI